MAARRVVVMGVAGCGKSSLGRALAARLGLAFVEGDDWHPPRNVALMRAGTPLGDADRAEWLDRLAGRLGAAHASGQGVVLACSALKRRYRDTLRRGAPGLRFVWLHAPEPVLAARLAAREGHYMPASLLPSQLQALEPPGDDEHALALDAGQPLARLVEDTVRALEHAGAADAPPPRRGAVAHGRPGDEALSNP